MPLVCRRRLNATSSSTAAVWDCQSILSAVVQDCQSISSPLSKTAACPAPPCGTY
jgi:hypothetical protein